MKKYTNRTTHTQTKQRKNKHKQNRSKQHETKKKQLNGQNKWNQQHKQTNNINVTKKLKLERVEQNK